MLPTVWSPGEPQTRRLRAMPLSPNGKVDAWHLCGGGGCDDRDELLGGEVQDAHLRGEHWSPSAAGRTTVSQAFGVEVSLCYSIQGKPLPHPIPTRCWDAAQICSRASSPPSASARRSEEETIAVLGRLQARE